MNKFLDNITKVLSVVAGMLMMLTSLTDYFKQEEITVGLVMLYLFLWLGGFGMVKLTIKRWI